MHPIPLPALQNAAGGPFWAVLAVFCGDFDRAVSWFAAPGLAGLLQSMDFIGLLDVRVLDVWMFWISVSSWKTVFEFFFGPFLILFFSCF